MRRSLGLTLDEVADRAGVWRNRLSRLERGRSRPASEPWILGRVLPILKQRFAEGFPETKGDPYAFIAPAETFGGWLKQLRLRRALKLRELAHELQVRPFTVIRYEAGLSRPGPKIRARLKRRFRLNGELDRLLGK